jgi:hypothetical protein
MYLVMFLVTSDTLKWPAFSFPVFSYQLLPLIPFSVSIRPYIRGKSSIHLFLVFREYIIIFSVRSQLLWQNFARVLKSWKKKCTSQSTCFTHTTIDPLFHNIIFYVHTVSLSIHSLSTLARPNSPCLANIVSIFFRGHVLHYFFRLSVGSTLGYLIHSLCPAQ